MGLYNEALVLMKEALLLKRSTFGEDHSLTAIGHAGVANLLHTLGRGEEAIPYYERALEIYRILEDRESMAETMIDLAQVRLANDPASASSLLESASRLIQDPDESWHLAHAVYMTSSALQEHQGKIPTAALEAARAVRLARALAPVSKEHAQALALQGRLLLQLGVDRGIALLEHSCRIFAEIGNEWSVDSARTQGNLGLWLVRFHIDFPRGERLLRRSFETLQQLLPESSDSVSRAKLMWAESLPFLGRYSEALLLATAVHDSSPPGELKDGAASLKARLQEFVNRRDR